MRHSMVIGSGVVAMGAALTLASPALAASSVPTAGAGCTLVSQSSKPAPAVGSSAIYPAGTAGTVTILRTATRLLKITAAKPAAGYTAKTLIAAGAKVQEVFKPATGPKTDLVAAPGTHDPNRLHVYVYSCP
jgi:hypothetical protein